MAGATAGSYLAVESMDLRRHAADAPMARVLTDYLMCFEHRPRDAMTLCTHAIATAGGKVRTVERQYGFDNMPTTSKHLQWKCAWYACL